jgi:hypothetical protein
MAKVLLTPATEPYRETLEAIHALLPLANVPAKEKNRLIIRFHWLCEVFDAGRAYDLLHELFKRKRKTP